MGPTVYNPINRLLRRGDAEHVVLADCKGSQNANDLSSEIAYFGSGPSSNPDDISVATSNGSYTQWADATTSGLFTNTGVVFTAQLGKSGKAGDYAGTGDNGYAQFKCWQADDSYLYSHNNKNCSMAYDCDHSATAPTFTSSPTPTASSTSTASDASTGGSSGLSTGAIVGLSIGVAIGAIALIGIAAFFIYRHWRANKPGPAGDGEGEGEVQKGGFYGQPKESPLPTSSMATTELESPPIVYELYGHQRPAEMHNDYVRGEIDGTPRAELGTPDYPPGYQADGGQRGRPV
ncbi:hypothetical protein F4779DRAFT_597956 [Xylariaceae sp. FL0662B]|nr:hypothetical protein F4779DRAFT_597956 [Xylariaceae sp. FL0662B]